MTLAAIDWLSISINLLLVIFVIVCLLMTLLILMQRPKQEGLGAAFGGGLTDQVFGARTTNVLQRGTVYLGTMFFVLALVLAILIGIKNKESDLLKKDKAAAEEAAAGTPAGEVLPPADSKPAGEDLPSSLLEELPDAPPADGDAPAGDADKPADSALETEGATGTVEAPQPQDPPAGQPEQP